jgi:hypothetical protein
MTTTMMMMMMEMMAIMMVMVIVMKKTGEDEAQLRMEMRQFETMSQTTKSRHHHQNPVEPNQA